ncbi:MAG TPA: amidase [Acidimicrobiales bacterium]|nr:amidase [Acidimicrobiales bacterium]
MSATWITKLDPDRGATGPRVAVKDAIDVEGVPTTVGCAAVADVAEPAAADADCVASARVAGARIVGKANLHELCFGTGGTNPWFGDPVNPAAPDRLPGGSSSGSAVAVATDEADVGYGTDTGGSVRLPAACCGIAGLKTTIGRISTKGVWPLSSSLDTIGPLARDVAGIVDGMRLLEPGFTPSGEAASTVGRFRVPGTDPDLEAAVDAALAAAGFDLVAIDLPGWMSAGGPFATLILTEGWEADRAVYERASGRISDEIRSRLESGRGWDRTQIPAAKAAQQSWRDEVASAFGRVQLIAMPTLAGQPPLLEEGNVPNHLVFPWNVAGTPALALPIAVEGWSMPGSLQLCGPAGGEELLCATGFVVEEAAS